MRKRDLLRDHGQRPPDSGVPVADALGIAPIVIEREAWRAERQLLGGTEVPFLAAGGGSGLIGFHGAREHLMGAAARHGLLRRLDLEPGVVGARPRRRPQGRFGPRLLRVPAPRRLRQLRPGLLGCARGGGGRRDQPLGGDGAPGCSAPATTARSRAGSPRRPESRGTRSGTTKRAVPKAQPHRDPDFLMPEPKRAYFEWLRAKRERLGLRGPVSPLRDRAEFRSRDLALRAHVALRVVPRSQGQRVVEGQARPPAPAPAKPHPASTPRNGVGARPGTSGAYAEGKRP